MPLISKIRTYSFDRDGCCAVNSFALIKNLLMMISFLSMIAGFVLIGTGGIIVADSNGDLVNLAGTIGAAAISIGVIVSGTSFLGCFGAAKEKGTMLKWYFAVLLVLVILQVSVGGAAYSKGDEIPGMLESAWKREAETVTNSTILLAIERQNECCGYRNSSDFPVTPLCVQKYNDRGCAAVLTDFLVQSVDTIGVVGITIGIIQLVALIFSIVMYRKISRKENSQAALLNEAWRVNRTKVQYGYQNYQYV